ncbi:hypothetical protein HpMMM63_06820 [Helicobacter pylori]
MAVVVKVVNGKIQEFENGSHKRTYGSNAVNVQFRWYSGCNHIKG